MKCLKLALGLIFFALTAYTQISLAQTITPPVSSPVVAPQPQPSDLLQGEWVSNYPIVRPDVEIYSRFVFTPDTMAITATCFYPLYNSDLSVSVLTPVAYHQNNLYIQQQTQAVVNDGYRNCSIRLVPQVWQFYFDGTGKAILFTPGPYQQRYELVRTVTHQ